MRTSDFNNEIGALIRRLQSQVIRDPSLMYATQDHRDALEKAIIALVAAYVALEMKRWDEPEQE